MPFVTWALASLAALAAALGYATMSRVDILTIYDKNL